MLPILSMNIFAKRKDVEEDIQRLLSRYAKLRAFVQREDGMVRREKELKDSIHSKSQELQKVYEDVQDAKRQKNEVVEHMQKLQDEYSRLTQAIRRQLMLIQLDAKKWEKNGAEYDRKVYNASQKLEEVNSGIINTKKERKLLDRKNAEITRALKIELGIGEDIKELKGVRSLLSAQVKELERKTKNEEKKTTQLRGVSKRLYDSILLALRDTQSQRNNVNFYARRIVKYYKENGRVPPQVFKELKPHIYVGKRLLNKLKYVS